MLITFANRVESDQVRQNVGPDLDPRFTVPRFSVCLCQSDCLASCLSVCQPAYPACPQPCFSAHLTSCSPACLSILCLPFSLISLPVPNPAFLSVCLSESLSTCLSVCLFFCLSSSLHHPHVCLTACPPVSFFCFPSSLPILPVPNHAFQFV